MTTKIKMTEAEYLAHCNCSNGLCTECEEIQEGGVEPDAEEYECEACKAHAVMGMEQALLNGHIDITDDEESSDSSDSDDE